VASSALIANLSQTLFRAAARRPDDPALIWQDHCWTWAHVAARIRSIAAGLSVRGVSKGDRILVQARNSNALFESMWASWTLGAVWVPVNHRLTPPEVAYIAEACRASVYVGDDIYAQHMTAVAHSNCSLKATVTIGSGGQLNWETIASQSTAEWSGRPADVGYDDLAWIFYTSGTTGHPKGAMLTHGQLTFVMNNYLCDIMPGTTGQDVSLVVAPLSHGAGVHAIAQVAACGATVIMAADTFDCAIAWALVDRHRVTNLFVVPTMLARMVRHESVDRVDHQSLRYVVYAGSPMYRADQELALKKLGPVLVQFFGLAEVTCTITVLPREDHTGPQSNRLLASCGYARTGMEVQVTNDEGKTLNSGETGEFCVRGPAVFSGYLDNPEATAKAFRDGWFRTGDIGHLDSAGYLYITGRASDMYISGGSNIYPREIEELLLEDSALAEVAVVGIPDPDWGEIGVAVVIVAEGKAVAPASLLRHLEGRLAKYKWPRRIQIWNELPKSSNGKILKSVIRQKLVNAGGNKVEIKT
jgi:acyl-CoA synthetase (AMP-forming)/AMP-acid ligase II